MATTQVFLLGESHGYRSLVAYSPWGHRKSDMTEAICLLFFFLINFLLKDNCFIELCCFMSNLIKNTLNLIY